MNGRCFFFIVLLVVSCVNESSNQKKGKQIFEKNCSTCHGLKGSLQASGASDLTISKLNKQQLIQVIRDGRRSMGSYKGTLSDSQIDSVAKYVMDLRPKK